jgi:hypothetical protein
MYLRKPSSEADSPSTGVPQAEQKAAPGGRSTPQLVQADPSFDPHDMQKAAPTGFSVEQVEQVMGPSSVIAVGREMERSDRSWS